VKLKPKVSVAGLRPEMLVALMAAQEVYRELGQPLVVTSAVDGRHSITSLHYAGCAVDLRTRDLGESTATTARDMIAHALPEDYDCILEKDHIHLEWQPRRRSA
jgi:hypothetical protein